MTLKNLLLLNQYQGGLNNMGTVFKRGKNWTIEYKTRNGKSKHESIGKIGIITKTMAREVLKTRE